MTITKVQRIHNKADKIISRLHYYDLKPHLIYSHSQNTSFSTVTVYIEIKNRFGGATKLCPVTVTVHPSFQRNSSSQPSPDQEL